jgi:hypothetical protein
MANYTHAENLLDAALIACIVDGITSMLDPALEPLKAILAQVLNAPLE